MEKKKLDKILKKHAAWLNDKDGGERAKLMRKDGGAFSCADVRDNGKPLGYWDDTGRCNRSRRNAQKTGSHRRRAIIKRRIQKECRYGN